MELAEGGTLDDYIKNMEKHNFCLQELQASKVIKQILLGLSHIHSKNIIHRDLKPVNILFSQQNNIEKLKDSKFTTLRAKVEELVDYTNKSKPLADGITIYSQETSTGIMLSAKKPSKQNISSAPASASTAQPELYICKITGTSAASGLS